MSDIPRVPYYFRGFQALPPRRAAPSLRPLPLSFSCARSALRKAGFPRLDRGTHVSPFTNIGIPGCSLGLAVFAGTKRSTGPFRETRLALTFLARFARLEKRVPTACPGGVHKRHRHSIPPAPAPPRRG